jgi:hypothetical protein
VDGSDITESVCSSVVEESEDWSGISTVAGFEVEDRSSVDEAGISMVEKSVEDTGVPGIVESTGSA